MHLHICIGTKFTRIYKILFRWVTMEMAFLIHPITLHVNYKNSNLALQLLFARDNVIKPENTCKVAPMGTQTIKPQGLFKDETTQKRAREIQMREWTRLNCKHKQILYNLEVHLLPRKYYINEDITPINQFGSDFPNDTSKFTVHLIHYDHVHQSSVVTSHLIGLRYRWGRKF